ncbi:MAG: molybdopterin-dependent oxidoreductase [Myxococcales bacterium]
MNQRKLYGSPDRLEFPEKRIGGWWERISWDQAISEIGAKVKSLRAEHGADPTKMYVGTAAGFSMLQPIFAQGFMQGLGSKSIYGSASQLGRSR